VDQALVARVVEVDKVLLPLRGDRSHIDCVAVVLRRDVALARRQIQRWDVMALRDVSNALYRRNSENVDTCPKLVGSRA
jgi:hypothetical protein